MSKNMNIMDNEPSVAIDSQKKRKFLGIHFACCNIYGRIYNYSGRQYEGKCPKCLRSLTIRVGKDGVSNRFFVAS